MTTALAPTSSGPQLRSLTSLRVFAALFVLLFHSQLTTVPGLGPLQAVLRIGYAGVAFFFVLSGFILVWSTRADLTRVNFWWRRFARIYPLHIAALLLSVALLFRYAPLPWLGQRPSLATVLPTLLLLQAWLPDSDFAFGGNVVSWSLSCEAFFYAIFPLLMVLARRLGARQFLQFFIGLFILTTVIQVAGALTSVTLDEYFYTLPLTRLGEFTVGMALGYGFRNAITSRPSLWLVMGSTALAALAVVVAHAGPSQSHGFVNPLVTPLFAIVILSAAHGDLAGRRTLLSNRGMVWAGEVSFAIYLIHLTFIHAVTTIWQSTLRWNAASTAALVVCEIVSVVLFSAALHHGLERPINRALRRLVQPPERERSDS